MTKAGVGLGLLTLLVGPAGMLLLLAVLLNPAAQAECLPAPGVSVVAVPERLSVTTADGTPLTLRGEQLHHAATILSVGRRTQGVGAAGIKVALMAALTESSLSMLSNTSAYPDSASMPNDGDGSDHDSLGMFQMRPSTGWGTVAQLMDPDYQARAFFGGPSGPNHGSPRGLLDIPGWQQLPPAVAAQAVEVSAYPNRYANYAPVAATILRTLTQDAAVDGDGGPAPVPKSTRVVHPLPAGTWQRTSTFGPRVDPITGVAAGHTGVDYAAPAGTPILAVADGRVVFAGPVSSGYAHLILIQHTIEKRTVVSGYAHMFADGIRVREGEFVTAGEHIGDVGSDGKSTGPHLHLEIRLRGAAGAAIDPEPWLTTHRATSAPAGSTLTNNRDCVDEAATAPAAVPADRYTGANPGRMVDDPTSTGQITARTAFVLDQVRTRFPDSAWACWRAGSSGSEHPRGRACDATFGNAIGQAAAGPALAAGWRVTNWVKVNAQRLGVEYLIWQGRIWSVARDAEGWRPYDGGGMHDPAAITGGHYDHLHLTCRP